MMESGDAMSEVGTLKEIKPQPGDKIGYKCDDHHIWIVDVNGKLRSNDGIYVRDSYYGDGVNSNWSGFKVISRATPPLRTWAELTPAEKGALLLAHHQGEVIEWSYKLPWKTQNDTNTGIIVWSNECYYRIKARAKIEAVTWYFSDKMKGAGLTKGPRTTHRITFQTIDGKPDCASVKMEEV